MARVSLGVILPGDPKYIQKPHIFVQVLGVICKYGWIASPIGIIVSLILMFVDDWTHAYSMFRWLVTCILLYCVAHFIWDESHRCKFCNHFFCLRRISDNKFVDSRDASVSRTRYDTHNGIAFDSGGNSTLFTSINSSKEYGTEVTKTYTHNVRCRCCGAVTNVETHNKTQHY